MDAPRTRTPFAPAPPANGTPVHDHHHHNHQDEPALAPFRPIAPPQGAGAGGNTTGTTPPPHQGDHVGGPSPAPAPLVAADASPAAAPAAPPAIAPPLIRASCGLPAPAGFSPTDHHLARSAPLYTLRGEPFHNVYRDFGDPNVSGGTSVNHVNNNISGSTTSAQPSALPHASVGPIQFGNHQTAAAGNRAVANTPSTPLPSSLPAAFFPALGSPDDEHVTVWHPATGKTVAGNAAPYRRNLKSWLATRAGWEEKADELKSSKRRSAARRTRSAADAFAALCAYPVAGVLVASADKMLDSLHDPSGAPLARDSISTAGWGNDDYVRLQEALFRLAQQVHEDGPSLDVVPRDAWSSIASAVSQTKALAPVVLVSRHILFCGIEKHRQALAAAASSSSPSAVHLPGSGFCPTSPTATGDPSEYRNLTDASTSARRTSAPIPFTSIPDGSTSSAAVDLADTTGSLMPLPSSFGTVMPPTGRYPPGDAFLPVSSVCQGVSAFPGGNLEPSSLPNMDAATHFLDRSFRCPREPRITVWEPSTGRTVSGNAAPCRKNLEQWLQEHPGWFAKGEEQLSSSRRARRTPPAPVPPRTSPLSSHGMAGQVTSLTSSAGTQLPASAPHPGRDSPVLSAALGLLAIGQVEQSIERRQSSAMTSSVSSGSSNDIANDDEDVEMQVAMDM